ncbi:CDP-glycerol glycerophosphotransferase family protein [Tamlana sp. 2201CG12-4]|uniref:CDP-glycerol glycerophosphotransferase family protein n=1 Tax=Tamlana sp. 2201CG12-4 TaxID=3112582 RepID=UPI002DBD03ED|nr:CDP-glycerol glycerophosphotransferase family protein [Tamlana sp. 2201CG12-4]MEC3907597.1 CDP-glycerol glycerophosphotransferase family protein [Tamlana sp. 2201CG12-4]
MKLIFFCQNTYAFGIIEPIREIALKKEYEFIWFLREKLVDSFPFKKDSYITSLKKLKKYPSDAIIVPGNEVPHYLKGVKVQIFHGLAGEKKSHFRIRHYFDLYLTQGPYFTERFKAFKAVHKNFEVMETGWSKLDQLYKTRDLLKNEKEDLLSKHNAKQILLYAPTFTPYLTSAEILKNEIAKLAINQDYLILIKFHPLMDEELISHYKNLATQYNNIIYQEENNITKFLVISDLMISDTSSVVYEFLLLNKPVLTFNNIAEHKYWEDINNSDSLIDKVHENLTQDSFKKERAFIIENYHPYEDGKSSIRMIEAIEQYISKFGVPKKRKLSPYRKYRIHKRFRDSL